MAAAAEPNMQQLLAQDLPVLPAAVSAGTVCLGRLKYTESVQKIHKSYFGL